MKVNKVTFFLGQVSSMGSLLQLSLQVSELQLSGVFLFEGFLVLFPELRLPRFSCTQFLLAAFHKILTFQHQFKLLPMAFQLICKSRMKFYKVAEQVLAW